MENFEISSYKAQKKNIVFLGYFRLSDGYKYLRTPIVNQILLSCRAVSQLSTTSGSRGMDFGHFGVWGPNVGPKNGFCPPFSQIIQSVLKTDP